MRLIWWILNYLFKNLGKAGDGIYRSGQPGFIRRRIMYWIIKPKTRINLAYSPNHDHQDDAEKEFLEKNGVKVYTYTWSSGGPDKKVGEVLEVCSLLSSAAQPIWIGCEGGKDRTGGVIGYWKRTKGEFWGEIVKDFQTFGMPAEGWLTFIFD